RSHCSRVSSIASWQAARRRFRRPRPAKAMPGRGTPMRDTSGQRRGAAHAAPATTDLLSIRRRMPFKPQRPLMLPAVAAATMLLALGAYLVVSGRSNVNLDANGKITAREAADAADVATTGASAKPAAVAPQAQETTLRPLPPEDAPLVEVYDELV